MNTLTFYVDKRNEELFNARLDRLIAGCEAHELACEVIHNGTEVRKYDIIELRKKVGEREVEFDKYTLNWEEPDYKRYLYVGVLREVGNANILDVDGNFKTEYLDNEEYNIAIPDEIYYVDLECEHCMSGRELKRSHVIFDLDTDMFFQVAKGCLTGYIYFSNSRDIELEFKHLEIWEDLEKVDWGRNSKTTDFVKFDSLCKHALSYFMEQEELKYISRTEARYSQPRVTSSITDVVQRLDSDNLISEKSEQEYAGFVDYLLNADGIDRSNLEIMINENLVPDFKWGYLVYLAFRYLKGDEKKKTKTLQEELKETSEYVGEVGEKLEVEVTFYNEFSFGTEFGEKTMYFFNSDEGNVFVWSTMKYIKLEKGERLKLKGKVTRHNEYNGTKQTFLSYVKILEMEEQN